VSAVAARLARSPRARVALAIAAVPAAALLALAPGGLSTSAARAGLAAAGVGTVAALLRRRRRPAGRAELSVAARAPLSGDAGLAVVETGGRRLLVGWSRGGVSFLAELDGASREARP
jgi:flagellar protein FliO/FliZ